MPWPDPVLCCDSALPLFVPPKPRAETGPVPPADGIAGKSAAPPRQASPTKNAVLAVGGTRRNNFPLLKQCREETFSSGSYRGENDSAFLNIL